MRMQMITLVWEISAESPSWLAVIQIVLIGKISFPPGYLLHYKRGERVAPSTS